MAEVRTCTMEGCERKHYAHGLCDTHEKRLRRHGNPKHGFPALRERLFSRLIINPETGCLLWTGSCSEEGYGRLGRDGRKALVHRVMYELFVGPIPDGLEIDHLCRVRNCAAPGHLEAVTGRVNKLRGNTITAAAAGATHCPQKHEYDLLNTWISPAGQRRCRACRREKRRAKKAARS
jgi:hypothetical protein